MMPGILKNNNLATYNLVAIVVLTKFILVVSLATNEPTGQTATQAKHESFGQASANGLPAKVETIV
jgi:hypothetical protein